MYQVKLFDRTYDMLEQMPEIIYKETIDGANVETDDAEYTETITGASDATSLVTENSARSTGRETQNIFGVAETGAVSAHLMPQSKTCASLWYHLVPWILCRVDDSNANPSITVHVRNNKSRWVVVQKCLHGFALQKKAGTPSLEEFDSTNYVASTSSVGKANVDDNKAIVDGNDEEESDAEPPAKKLKRENGVGIKHFKSNRIRLYTQQLYLDTYHCLLIVPILTVDDGKNWHGSGYSAIVLAGEYIEGNENLSAVEEYNKISANRGKVPFADPNELELAHTLLENMIFCICKSSRDTSSTEFHKTLKEKYYNKLDLKVHEKAYPRYIERNTIDVPVPTPTSNHWNNSTVRKITFSDVSGENPAPDPVLLLGKATSNWLKLQEICVLPACDEDESSSDSSDLVSPSSDAFALREWSYDMVTGMRPPHVKGIVEVSCRPEVVDEPSWTTATKASQWINDVDIYRYASQ